MLHNKGGLNLEGLEATNSNINLDDMRDKKMKDKKLNVALREIILSCCFVALSMAVSYQMSDPQGFYYQNSLKNLFGAGTVNNTFSQVKFNLK